MDHLGSMLHIGTLPSPPAIDRVLFPPTDPLPRHVLMVVAPAPTGVYTDVPVLVQSCTGGSQVCDKPLTCLLPASGVSHYLEVVQSLH